MKYKLPFRTPFVLALIAAISIAVAGQQTTPTAPSVERLRAHIQYLASDKLAGRKTGGDGANLAAEYIAREFARLGLRRSIGHDTAGMSILEADSPNRYLQKFPYVAAVELGKGNSLTFRPGQNTSPTSLRVGEDWLPLSLSLNAKIENAQVSFVGYGITASALKYDDYEMLNMSGRIAIALSGRPDSDNPHGAFARYEDVRWKAIAARNAGANALIVIAREEDLKIDRLSRLRYDNSAGDAGLPVVVISRRAAASLFGMQSPTQLAGLEGETNRVALARVAQPGSAAKIDSSYFSFVPDRLSLSTDIVRREVAASNVVGILDGSDPKLKSEAIIIGAHYDHLGLGGDGSLAPKEGEIHHGADDNASGTAGMLELARLFSSEGARPRRTIVFVAFGGEEEGLLGSNYYVNHPIVPLANTAAMFNMDMIGRLKNQNLIVGGIGTATEWRPLVEAANLSQGLTVSLTGVPVSVGGVVRNRAPIVVAANGQTIVTSDSFRQFQLTLNEDGFGPSDHSSFYAKKIPVLFFWTGTHEDYHKPSDTADKINYEDEARILSLVAKIVRDVDAEEKRPTYAVAKSQAAGRTGGFSVSLGTIPSYADSTDGLLIDGVRDDTPAAKAGIKAGDKIVKLAGREIRNVYDYTAALGEMRAGQEYEVELMRNGERMKMKIIPAARK
ncbi:MAG TPA: M20/M25/M40 family metallo-hydrolase [Pyrinomonadaceae bacterium]|nr:M20/M25/M40 family metallo-hydrolase [Pyrinomonadaceae bacterium]